MQRKYTEPNTYINNLPQERAQEEELYDDVDLLEVITVRFYSPASLLLWGHFV